MKTILPAACIKCGSTLWYVHRSGRRCVPCAHNRALTGRARIRALEAEVERLRNAVAEEREAIAKMFDGNVWAYDYRDIAAAIRARGDA